MKRFEQRSGIARWNPGMTLATAILVMATALMVFSFPAEAAQVTLAWDANTEPDLAKYTLHYGQASRTYDTQIDVNNVTTYCTVTGLLEGRTYFFAVTATDLTGNRSPYSNEASYTVPGIPEINLVGNGVSIVNGDTAPSVADHTDFGSVAVGGGTLVRTFTVQNLGSAALNLTGNPLVSVSGANASDFAVTARPTTPVAAGGNVSFQVTFTPSADGVRSAGISIANDDGDENPYSFSIQGTGATTPEMDVSGNSISIVDGDTTPSASDQTDFGTVSLMGGAPVVHAFTIRNLGTGPLSLTGNPLVSLSGANAGDFTVSAMPQTPIGVGGSTTFQVTFAPSAEGVRAASISVANNDADENPYNFSIQGSGLQPAETIAAPALPSGPPTAYALASYTYNVSGASATNGDSVQYYVEWGDGTSSDWLPVGTLAASKTWAAPTPPAESYSVSVRVKARCAVHTSLESAWSNVLTVNVVRDITPPAAPSGLKLVMQ